MTEIGDVHFTLEFDGEDVIWLIDAGTGLSITNGAEVVIAELYALLGADDFATKRLIYRDTMGNWDGIAHRGDRFISFVSLGGIKDRHHAIIAARAYRDWPR